MKYLVFESGSRAGTSAELFFLHYLNRTGSGDELYLSDLDTGFSSTVSPHTSVHHIHDSRAMAMLEDGDTAIFPADELSRQTNARVRQAAARRGFSRVETWYYDKLAMNRWLTEATAGCAVKVPPTFDSRSLCLRPASRSAGSRNIMKLDNYCATLLIDIAEEYVIDVLRNDSAMHLYPRQVTIKNGYDRFIRLLPHDGELARAVREFIVSACPANTGIYSDIFHLQIVRSTDGTLYYIESSKRISGTSLVNLTVGMDPFGWLNGDRVPEPGAVDGRWHRYEDFVLSIGRQQ